jgi:hypothetical protein
MKYVWMTEYQASNIAVEDTEMINRSSTSSEQYFSYIQDENNLMNTNNCKK